MYSTRYSRLSMVLDVVSRNLKEGFWSPSLAMRSKSEETRRAAGKIENVGAPDGSDCCEGVPEQSV
jgi:hypothetical protein